MEPEADVETEDVGLGVVVPEGDPPEPRMHDTVMRDEVFNASLAQAVQSSMLTFQQSLDNQLKKKMRIKLVALQAAAHACSGVDSEQVAYLIGQCKINDDGTLTDNLKLVAGLIGARQKVKRVNIAEANLANAKTGEQRKIWQQKLETQKQSLPHATICPALKVLIEQQEEGALDAMPEAEEGGVFPIQKNAGGDMLRCMITDVRKKGHVMLHEPTLEEWRAMGLYQYKEFADVWPDEFKLLGSIATHRVREWLQGKKPNAAKDGPTWWAVYARRCGYVERDETGAKQKNADGQTIPLAFDSRFEIDHAILSSSAHESKDYLLSGLLDHPDNYMIVYKGVNQNPLFKTAFGKLCLLKGYILGDIGQQYVHNVHQHRQRSLENNRQALKHAAKNLLSEEIRNQHLKPYSTTFKPRQEKNMKQLVTTLRKRGDIRDMLTPKEAAEDAPAKRAKGAESASDDKSHTSATADLREDNSGGSGSNSDTEGAGSSSEEQEAQAEADGARTPPPAGEITKATGKRPAAPNTEQPKAKKVKTGTAEASVSNDANQVTTAATCRVCAVNVTPKSREKNMCRRHQTSASCNNGCLNVTETLKDSEKYAKAPGEIVWIYKNQQTDKKKLGDGCKGYCGPCYQRTFLNNRKEREDDDEKIKATNEKIKKKIKADAGEGFKLCTKRYDFTKHIEYIDMRL